VNYSSEKINPADQFAKLDGVEMRPSPIPLDDPAGIVMTSLGVATHRYPFRLLKLSVMKFTMAPVAATLEFVPDEPATPEVLPEMVEAGPACLSATGDVLVYVPKAVLICSITTPNWALVAVLLWLIQARMKFKLGFGAAAGLIKTEYTFVAGVKAIVAFFIVTLYSIITTPSL
jgi:hypothetical protein